MNWREDASEALQVVMFLAIVLFVLFAGTVWFVPE